MISQKEKGEIITLIKNINDKNTIEEINNIIDIIEQYITTNSKGINPKLMLMDENIQLEATEYADRYDSHEHSIRYESYLTGAKNVFFLKTLKQLNNG